jgi:hypothetical protein
MINDRDPKFASCFWQTLWRRLGTRMNMSSSRHPETGGLTERVNNTCQQLLRCFCCYDGSNLTNLLPQVEFAYNAFRALGIEHIPFKANLGLSLEEPPDLLFSMRPSIPVSQDALTRLRLLNVVRAVVRSMLELHKDDMQAHSEPSTAPHFVGGDRLSIITTSLFLPKEPKRKLRDRQLGPFYSRGANWETQLQIGTSSDSTLTPCVSCEQPTTMLYRFATTCCPSECSCMRRRGV